jgi:hypothetical protein
MAMSEIFIPDLNCEIRFCSSSHDHLLHAFGYCCLISAIRSANSRGEAGTSVPFGHLIRPNLNDFNKFKNPYLPFPLMGNNLQQQNILKNYQLIILSMHKFATKTKLQVFYLEDFEKLLDWISKK